MAKPRAQIPKTIYSVRGWMSCIHLIVDGESACLIDTGLAGEWFVLGRLLRRLGLGWSSIRGILLTHGHLDHTGNLARLKALTGAPVYGHEAEQLHVDGLYPYTGISRVCGRMEAVGRFALGYRSCRIDQCVVDGDILPFCGGLEVIHLPGHTKGHCGFYSAAHDLLFSGDLFASYFFNTHLPPPILNSCPEFFPASIARVRQLNPALIVPNHYDIFDGALMRERFDALCRKLDFAASAPAPSGPS